MREIRSVRGKWALAGVSVRCALVASRRRFSPVFTNGAVHDLALIS
jgi:hypothetical protein